MMVERSKTLQNPRPSGIHQRNELRRGNIRPQTFMEKPDNSRKKVVYGINVHQTLEDRREYGSFQERMYMKRASREMDAENPRDFSRTLLRYPLRRKGNSEPLHSFSSLNTLDQKILMLYMNGKPHREIADHLKLTQTIVSNRISGIRNMLGVDRYISRHKAIRQLRRLLGNDS